jgi:hypothetical protein
MGFSLTQKYAMETPDLFNMLSNHHPLSAGLQSYLATVLRFKDVAKGKLLYRTVTGISIKDRPGFMLILLKAGRTRYGFGTDRN